ncbi:nuclear GTPase SLIP-GC [Acrasis kona]|uniref:Nuclear GTPase SLIP-GC n=1 Tax=Acrasis kona TaxID=1008807 RepID=A0AAW2YVP8_9EUKA
MAEASNHVAKRVGGGKLSASALLIRILFMLLSFPLDTILLLMQLDAATISPNKHTSASTLPNMHLEQLYNNVALAVAASVIKVVLQEIVSKVSVIIAGGEEAGKIRKIFGNGAFPNIMQFALYPFDTFDHRFRLNGLSGFSTKTLQDLVTTTVSKGLLSYRIKNILSVRLRPTIDKKVQALFNKSSAPVVVRETSEAVKTEKIE